MYRQKAEQQFIANLTPTQRRYFVDKVHEEAIIANERRTQDIRAQLLRLKDDYEKAQRYLDQAWERVEMAHDSDADNDEAWICYIAGFKR